MYTIRQCRPDDVQALNQICLLTGDSGADASQLYRDPTLLGQYYAAPYAVLEPDLAFALVRQDIPYGYVLGARDSADFYARREREWFPALRERYPQPDPADDSPDAQIIRLFYREQRADTAQAEYPAHLHIDILPEAQGQGWGRRLIETLLDRMRALDVAGVHLHVGKQNARAIGFYRRVGFHQLGEYPMSLAFGRKLA
ncbi:MAG TPA: GNAT family N-acetyltransferase [Roseiflexaceae bacterium]|nr:GNAT family N-acetyltransferase [Roseiflexaceae bacterium]